MLYRDDTVKEMEYIVRKLVTLRLWDDDQGRRWAKSAKDLDLGRYLLPGTIICIFKY